VTSEEETGGTDMKKALLAAGVAAMFVGSFASPVGAQDPSHCSRACWKAGSVSACIECTKRAVPGKYSDAGIRRWCTTYIPFCTGRASR